MFVGGARCSGIPSTLRPLHPEHNFTFAGRHPSTSFLRDGSTSVSTLRTPLNSLLDSILKICSHHLLVAFVKGQTVGVQSDPPKGPLSADPSRSFGLLRLRKGGQSRACRQRQNENDDSGASNEALVGDAGFSEYLASVPDRLLAYIREGKLGVETPI
jgi:hypothetical protein